ncbi:hypothetical protein COS31_02870 [Candidatus Roizmanbacteria bacterium CG02_land_8_20_14_3_00_36_15]|uniref:UDP-N-acetylglucosamine--N-acetylmuramyl-(pentapeptide) pyrophosphoryl-undecaprenol N-acetylglucosamine transferase n=2 Tax=Candidatus Roizmaniibacteriota TaxID=1752723 RepID=A0A2M8KMA0_9BACT|nr:MAG: hypothetical protein COS51_01340 [Candidatus Roizmanbacteria bacterium CG03_land_8_20_14_0_80_36_21]PIV37791.1 MAG: hypothetical protein COS31_02870 [Candidatus Roizmanbacteria bacterium CG02_land_8_20_14_3_00_36_15]PIY70009.1 MAG: hypothetical protein COY89_03355 [Candidatus Roizmanbacteria bacterium CG_4_10_14_0_8_um_filter_36_36]PJA52877.1 MAG: hypothetical protein CO166_03845 [Candidatus Roizmanbacteria bacterium CG_4_9_14_3_um_filter_36_11]PJC81623.1 MAG: hypothetical protein CO007
MKILITGGHLMPALAVIDEILMGDKDRQIEIFFAGRKYNSNTERTYSLEFKEISRRQVKFIPLVTGRLKRELSWKAFENILMIFVGLGNSLRILNSVKPDLVFSFGGYLGFPFIFWAFFKKIPSYIHEQTLNPGLANKLSALFVKKIFVSFPQSKNHFPQYKTIVVGNPIRKEIFAVVKKPFLIDKKLPVIYVTGGSLGSHSLNVHLMQILPQLLTKYIIIHQTGSLKLYDDYQMLVELRKKLPKKLKERYFLRDHFFSDEIGYIFSLADLVVSRSGANTFFELLSLKKPAILVPLPWSANHEQQAQAELFSSLGLGEKFSQFDQSNHLLILINHLYKNRDHYLKNFNNLKQLYPQDAADQIIKTIFAK